MTVRFHELLASVSPFMRSTLRRHTLLYLAFLVAGTPSLTSQTATISVDANRQLGSVNRLIFGQNIDAGDNAYIFSSDKTDPNLIQTGDGFWDPSTHRAVPLVLKDAKAIGTSVLRYPGGCLAHNFDWRRTVGSAAKKAGWLFGLDEYLELCSEIGATPLVTVSDYALPKQQMPENAASLVEYLNSPADVRHPWAMKRAQNGHPSPYDVQWFELGNESMHGNHRVSPHRQFTAEEYADYANATASAMRAVDPRVKIGIVMVPGSGAEVENQWNRTVLHLAGKSADFVVVHLYAPKILQNQASEAEMMQATMAVGEQSARHLSEYHQLIIGQLGRDLPIAVTEYNAELPETAPYRFSLGEALMNADLVRIMLAPEMNVATAEYWQFLNGYFGMLRTNEDSPSGFPSEEKAALPFYRLWGQHFGSKLVQVEVQAPHASFEGAGSVLPAFGDTWENDTQIRSLPLNQYLVTDHWMQPQLKITKSDESIELRIDSAKGNKYPILARIPISQAAGTVDVKYRVSFDAQFDSQSGSDHAEIGIGLGDSRGWDVTHSGIGLDGFGPHETHFESEYTPLRDTKSLDLELRVQANGENVHGTARIDNLRVMIEKRGHAPSYSLLTSTASLSTDSHSLYVIVFNKSGDSLIISQLIPQHFLVQDASYWEVTGPSLGAVAGIRETASGNPIKIANATHFQHNFPPHSMTVIELHGHVQNP